MCSGHIDVENAAVALVSDTSKTYYLHKTNATTTCSKSSYTRPMAQRQFICKPDCGIGSGHIEFHNVAVALVSGKSKTMCTRHVPQQHVQSRDARNQWHGDAEIGKSYCGISSGRIKLEHVAVALVSGTSTHTMCTKRWHSNMFKIETHKTNGTAALNLQILLWQHRI